MRRSFSILHARNIRDDKDSTPAKMPTVKMSAPGAVVSAPSGPRHVPFRNMGRTTAQVVNAKTSYVNLLVA